MDRQSSQTSHKRVRQLVCKESGKEQDPGDASRYPDGRLRPVRIGVSELFTEGERDQRSDEYPAEMEPEFDAPYRPELDGRFHVQLSDAGDSRPDSILRNPKQTACAQATLTSYK